MATYDAVTSRSDAGDLIEEEVAREIIDGVIDKSVVMSLAQRAPNMGTNTRRQPVTDTLPSAYFVGSDTGLKQTTFMKWAKRYLNVEEIAVLAPVPDSVAADADRDIFGTMLPRLIEAIVDKFDKAVVLGTDKPTSWEEGLSDLAATTQHTLALGALAGDLYDDLMAQDGLLSLIEQDGFDANGHLAHVSMKARLRGLRTTPGEPIFRRDMQGKTPYALEGAPMFFPKGFFSGTTILDMACDFSEIVYAIREDMNWKVFDSGVISDDDGKVIYNLMQQDAKVIRVVFRAAWQIPNPINKENSTNPTEGTSATAPTYAAGTRFMASTLTSS